MKRIETKQSIVIIAFVFSNCFSQAFIANGPTITNLLASSNPCFGTRSCRHDAHPQRLNAGFKLSSLATNYTGNHIAAEINSTDSSIAYFNSTTSIATSPLFTGGESNFIPKQSTILMPERTHHRIDYDEIQNIIDVSRPYYKLDNEILVADTTQQVVASPANKQIIQQEEPSSSSVTSTITDAVMPVGFCCTVDPEMPIGREQGSPISFSEAGRHMAIAGSVAAALNQPSERNGKYYYLAMDCFLEHVLDAKNSMESLAISTLHEDLKAALGGPATLALEDNKIVITAVCNELTKKRLLVKS